jgi:proteasome lid subunit RPN8/RPN11
MKPSKKNGYSQNPQLRFSPAAWAKLLYLRDYGPTEVGGFGIAPAEDLLYVQEVRLVRQLCTSVSVRFDDGAVADFFDEQVDAGRRPEQFARLWLHTHPGNCPLPSATDERTLARVFGAADWAVMFIVAQEGPTYARLRFNVGPGGAAELGVAVDYGRPFAASDHANWEAEYQANVAPALPWENEFPLSALQDFLEGGDFFGEEYVEPVPSHDDF